ncbi:MAG: tRNA (adenosine(37)-N6)-threonylcarbamoyltransferase complex dimerization subunit type 1 TsaB [Desulfobacterales bacterium]
MRILAVDTATTSCSVAIVDGASLAAEFTLNKKETHSKHLMEMIETVLKISGVDISAVDGFAVTKGPGSFTGLRIGMSTIMGLAAASGKPIVGVSSLAALAAQVSLSQDLICPLIDARKGEVYFSQYKFISGYLQRQTDEQVTCPEKIIDAVKDACLFVGNGAVLYENMILEKLGCSASFAPVVHNTIRASTVAHLSMTKFKGKNTDKIEKFSPNYIRRSDAELSIRNTSHSLVAGIQGEGTP